MNLIYSGEILFYLCVTITLKKKKRLTGVMKRKLLG